MIAVRATMVFTALVAASVAAAQQPVPQPAERQMDVMIVQSHPTRDEMQWLVGYALGNIV